MGLTLWFFSLDPRFTAWSGVQLMNPDVTLTEDQLLALATGSAVKVEIDGECKWVGGPDHGLPRY